MEPSIGIIKRVMRFRQFLLRGLAKVSAQWNLVAPAYNLRRLCKLKLKRARVGASETMPTACERTR